jgi:hypothetical protein
MCSFHIRKQKGDQNNMKLLKNIEKKIKGQVNKNYFVVFKKFFTKPI